MMSKETSPPAKETVLNGYEIKISLNDSILLIEAKHILTSKLYSIKICQNETEKLTRKVFSDVDSLYDSLIEGINNTDPSLKLSFRDDAILNFNYETIFCKRKKIYEFDLSLKEVDLNPKSIIKKKVEKLKKIIHTIDQEISQLQQKYYELINIQSSDNEDQLIQSLIAKHTMNLESRIASELEKQRIRIESALAQQTLNLESNIASEIEKQAQKIDARIREKFNIKDS